MGDSRPPEEIFAGIDARIKQAEPYRARLLAAMDDIMQNMTLTSWEGRAETVREVVVEWLFKNHPDFTENDKKQEAST
jgi:hypothetical protein